ncbi:MAG: class I SAM-dependent methyltransferase [Verrucomicrobia bacterium]|nr:class I SAM-dependent methyltransferase [Verrucomicrobiota bacterium]
MTEEISARVESVYSYGYDAEGKEVLLKDGTFQVMMEWEKPYMIACIDALKPSGDVLEVGFGLGYSATHIQSYHPKSHTIIEYHPVVAARAREWAKSYPNVTIVESTWQEALASLGEFDAIFFDDYPLESEAVFEKRRADSLQSEGIVKQGQALVKSVEETFPHMKEIRYSDADLSELAAQVIPQGKAVVFQCAQFLHELASRGQITPSQAERLLSQFLEAGLLTQEEAKPASKMACPPQANDRLYQFLRACLQSHLRKEGRFSCFLSSATSKFEDDYFMKEIIENPSLDFHEEEISIEVSPCCTYFTGSKALVITIVKRA